MQSGVAVALVDVGAAVAVVVAVATGVSVALSGVGVSVGVSVAGRGVVVLVTGAGVSVGCSILKVCVFVHPSFSSCGKLALVETSTLYTPPALGVGAIAPTSVLNWRWNSPLDGTVKTPVWSLSTVMVVPSGGALTRTYRGVPAGSLLAPVSM